jgi:AcrR family transcriptional regulator
MPPSRREELVESAMKVFYRNGFHCTGLDMILKESGISRMTLYNHFKSKDELIVAALRRRDELFRNGLMKFVEGASRDPVERIYAVFDFHEQWFNDEDFKGCMFINVSAEFCDAESPARRVSADHKIECVRYLTKLCEDAGLDDPSEAAERINLLLEGAIVTAYLQGKTGGNDSTPSEAARRARSMASSILS